MHCDTIMRIFTSTANLAENNLQIDLEKMRQGDYLLQNFAIFLDKEAEDSPYQTAKAMINCFYQQMEQYSQIIRPVTRYEEIIQNDQQHILSALLTMEEGAPLEGNVEKLAEFYQLGVRMLTLTWNYTNEIGFPNARYWNSETQTLSSQQGLTKRGIEIAQAMNELGMIIDVSHGSDQLVEEVLTHTTAPFVASHSNARACFPHFRNLPDSLIKKIADRGGVVGLNFSEDFLRTRQQKLPLINQLVTHATHMKNIGGIDVIGFGSDFDGIPVSRELPDATIFPTIYDAFQKAGFTTLEIEKIFHQNVLRLYKELLI